MKTVRYPSLYQINTRVWLTELSRRLGRSATLDDISDNELDSFARQGFDWIWLLSVWQTGPRSQAVSRSNPDWRHEFAATLPDLHDDDIPGSGFAIADYRVHHSLGGDAGLARLRERLRHRGMKLMLDFVPNHMGLDHRWIEDHPDYFVAGTEQDLQNEPQNFTRMPPGQGTLILAHGRDPYFPGWPDTVQLNYSNPATQEAMIGELVHIAGQCDAVRCDMAMLVLPEVFERTWRQRSELFWPKAITRVRETHPDFCFMAEVYWDLEWALQQQGFDYTYDKRLYDRLRDGHARPVREHFLAGLDYQDHLARFLENHDEPRASATFAPEVHGAAAVLTFLSPGLRFFHQGQLEGRRKRISPHLGRGPDEPVNPPLKAFYDQLLQVLRRRAIRDGAWKLFECIPAWAGNWTSECLIAFGWEHDSGDRVLAAVNYAPNQSQGYVRLSFANLGGTKWRFVDQLSSAVYERDGGDLALRGLYLDIPPWHAAVFSVEKCSWS